MKEELESWNLVKPDGKHSSTDLIVTLIVHPLKPQTLILLRSQIHIFPVKPWGVGCITPGQFNDFLPIFYLEGVFILSKYRVAVGIFIPI